MKVPTIRNRFALNALRVVALLVLVGLTGLLFGFAVGTPLGRIRFATSKAVRLDQARLGGSVDPQNAIAVQGDLPVGWKPADPAVAAFGILANEFCGEMIELPTALSEVKSSVFVNASGDSTVISQAVRVDQWQSAREYVRNVARTMGDCDKFFQNDPGGKRLRVDVKEVQSDPPITDFVARSFVPEDGSGNQTWSIMSVGDVIVGIRYIGKSTPQHSLLPSIQEHILSRTAPQSFSGKGETTKDATPTTAPGSTDATSTTVLDSGPVDGSPGGTDAPPDTSTNAGGGGGVDKPQD